MTQDVDKDSSNRISRRKYTYSGGQRAAKIRRHVGLPIDQNEKRIARRVQHSARRKATHTVANFHLRNGSAYIARDRSRQVTQRDALHVVNVISFCRHVAEPTLRLQRRRAHSARSTLPYVSPHQDKTSYPDPLLLSLRRCSSLEFGLLVDGREVLSPSLEWNRGRIEEAHLLPCHLLVSQVPPYGVITHIVRRTTANQRRCHGLGYQCCPEILKGHREALETGRISIVSAICVAESKLSMLTREALDNDSLFFFAPFAGLLSLHETGEALNSRKTRWISKGARQEPRFSTKNQGGRA